MMKKGWLTSILVLLGIAVPLWADLLPHKLSVKSAIKLKSQDKRCQVDEDCVWFETLCKGCLCGTPINRASLPRLERQRDETCSTPPSAVCGEKNCPTLRCVKGACVAAPAARSESPVSPSGSTKN